jgi:hypothetical protein
MSWASLKIGVVTDTRYDRADYPERTTVALNMINTFNEEGVDIILHLGDAYEGGFASEGTTEEKQQDYLNDKAIYEAIWESNVTVPTYWVIGERDKRGIGNDFFIENSSYCPSLNFTADIGEWRFICYSNIDYFNSTARMATDDTLAWLENALNEAKTEGKKIIVATHCWIDQDGTTTAYSSNADKQREKINAAARAGAKIKYVFQGHYNKYASSERDGIEYYAFDDARDTGSCAVVEIQDDDSLIVFGFGDQPSEGVTEVYVNGENGSDENTGETENQAWKTLDYANKKVGNGQTVVVMPSTYREYFRPSGGDDDAPIKWTFKRGCKLSGAEIFEDWSEEPDENGWYSIENVTTEVKVLLEDGVGLNEGDYISKAEKGTWDWNENTLYYAPSNRIPSKHMIEGGQRDKGIYIAADTNYLTIEGNGLDIYGCNSYGVYVKGGDSSTSISDFISRNNVYGVHSSSDETCTINISRFKSQNNIKQGLYIAGISSPTVSYGVISHNLLKGLWIKGTSASKIYNVVTAYNQQGIYLQNTGGNVELKNMISYYNSKYDFYASENGSKSIENSCISSANNTWGNAAYKDIFSEDPLFISPEAGNFRIRSASPCIDKGVSVRGIHNQDLVWSSVTASPDIGAYEYIPAELGHTVISLQILSGDTSSQSYNIPEINDDGKIGLEEVIFALMRIAGLI